VVKYHSDDLARVILDYDFRGEVYAEFTTSDQSEYMLHEDPCLWSPEDLSIDSYVDGNRCCIVPRVAQDYIKKQVYDYPYVNVNKSTYHDPNGVLDIVYISNGEPDEERWHDHAEYMTNRKIKWIRGVNGRTAAYQAAANASTTPWFFTVFAKLEVLGSEFDWTWKPDYFQEPKHYIFNARNPVNGLEYGHQGMIAYNRRLVLENNNPGIDFTLSQPHESVDMLSGTAHFNQDPWMTWRTAFREVVKLKDSVVRTPTEATEHRLTTWLTVANGLNAEWCLRGAADAVAYYNEVNGDYESLLKSFEWAWLRERFNSSYSNL
jgi:GMP synthase-like glutamine amidotransferase